MKLNLAQIQDPVLRENFRQVQDFLRTASQLEGFAFFTLTFTAATPAGQSVRLAHGLGYTPKDIIITQSTGPGVVSFLYAQFDQTFIYLTATGATTVRGLVGTFPSQPGI